MPKHHLLQQFKNNVGIKFQLYNSLFTALPSGSRGLSGNFYDIKSSATFWCLTDKIVSISSDSKEITGPFSVPEAYYGYAVRLIKT